MSYEMFHKCCVFLLVELILIVMQSINIKHFYNLYTHKTKQPPHTDIHKQNQAEICKILRLDVKKFFSIEEIK